MGQGEQRVGVLGSWHFRAKLSSSQILSLILAFSSPLYFHHGSRKNGRAGRVGNLVCNFHWMEMQMEQNSGTQSVEHGFRGTHCFSFLKRDMGSEGKTAHFHKASYMFQPNFRSPVPRSTYHYIPFVLYWNIVPILF